MNDYNSISVIIPDQYEWLQEYWLLWSSTNNYKTNKSIGLVRMVTRVLVIMDQYEWLLQQYIIFRISTNGYKSIGYFGLVRMAVTIVYYIPDQYEWLQEYWLLWISTNGHYNSISVIIYRISTNGYKGIGYYGLVRMAVTIEYFIPDQYEWLQEYWLLWISTNGHYNSISVIIYRISTNGYKGIGYYGLVRMAVTIEYFIPDQYEWLQKYWLLWISTNGRYNSISVIIYQISTNGYKSIGYYVWSSTNGYKSIGYYAKVLDQLQEYRLLQIVNT